MNKVMFNIGVFPISMATSLMLFVRVEDARRVLNRLGRAVHFDPIKLKWKAPGTKHSKLNSDESLRNFDFKFNLRRCTWVWRATFCWARAFAAVMTSSWTTAGAGQGLTLAHFATQLEPYLTRKNTLYTLNTPNAPRIPQKALTLSRKVNECKPRAVGG
jgi:hypothetical protein